MRVLLDEQLPRQLAPLLTGHDVRTVQQQSWAGLKNGQLLDAAEAAGRKLKAAYPMLQIEIYDAVNKVRTLLSEEPAAG